MSAENIAMRKMALSAGFSLEAPSEDQLIAGVIDLSVPGKLQ
jgi:hypothetical protein